MDYNRVIKNVMHLLLFKLYVGKMHIVYNYTLLTMMGTYYYCIIYLRRNVYDIV